MCTFRASCYQPGCLFRTESQYLVVTLLEVNEKEEGVVAFGPLKTRSGLEPVPRCEPSTYQPISH